MSSSVDTFPLFNLPHVSIRNVTDFWNPFELCDFSMISKKTKKMAETRAKSFNKKPLIVDIDCHSELKFAFQFLENQEEKFKIEGKRNQKYNQNSLYEKVLNLDSDKNISIGLKFFDSVMKLFNTSFNTIQLFTDGMEEETLISVINWINSASSRQLLIPKVLVSSRKYHFRIATFIKNIQTNIDKLEIYGDFDPRKFSEPIKFHKNLMVNHYGDYLWIRFDLNLCLSFNCIEACGGSTLTDKNWNKIFKSWQNKESNLRLRSCHYTTLHKINWNIALDGLSPVLRDPRTTKRCYQPSFKNGHRIWIHGGVDIQRNDGKIMTIGNFGHCAIGEDELVPQELIDRYDKIERTKNWNYNDVEIVNDVDDDDDIKDPLDDFMLFVW